MANMRNVVIYEIKKFIKNEDGLVGDEWKDNYYQNDDGSVTHVSKVDYMKLRDDDTLRFLMYLLLERDRASEYRITHLNKD